MYLGTCNLFICHITAKQTHPVKKVAHITVASPQRP